MGGFVLMESQLFQSVILSTADWIETVKCVLSRKTKVGWEKSVNDGG